jgi:hypothetical protein
MSLQTEKETVFERKIPMGKKSRVTRAMLRLSHERQFNGEDYQAVAIDLLASIKDGTEEELKELEASPEPECKCGFCAGAEWQ